MLKPSKRHFLRYDAQTYETQGFIDLSGKVQEMAQKPRFWQITAIECVQNNKNRQEKVGKVRFHAYELKKRRLTKQEIIECEKLGLTYIESAKHLKVPYMTLVSRINKMGIAWRGKGNRFGDEK